MKRIENGEEMRKIEGVRYGEFRERKWRRESMSRGPRRSEGEERAPWLKT